MLICSSWASQSHVWHKGVCATVCCNVLQFVAVCCSVAVCCRVLQCDFAQIEHLNLMFDKMVCVLQCVAVCCIVLQCVAVSYSVTLFKSSISISYLA